MNDIIEDLFKIYMSCIDSYNSKIYQPINDKYTIIDKSMLAVYLYVKIIEDRKEYSQEATNVLSNYLLKQIIYGETGNLAFEISDKSKVELYHKILDSLIIEKFTYKNRIMKELKYKYKEVKLNKYSELLMFLEDVAEYAILKKIVIVGNKEAIRYMEDNKNKIIKQLEQIEKEDYFYQEKSKLVSLIVEDKLNESQYGNLMNVALNLRDVYRYSTLTTAFPENVLFHQFTVTVISLIFAEYCNKELNENIDIYKILSKSLFHDFGEYKGTEIVTQFKNYNDVTIKMFAEIEENDEKELEKKIGTNLYSIIAKYKEGAEGYISELIDKVLGIMKLLVEVSYFHNYSFIKAINSIYQDRFKRFLKIENIDEIKNKSFYLEFLREYYIYIKESLVEKDLEYFFKYFTQEELDEYRNEIALLKSNPESFLK
ncbi:MAG: HD domain-containing protein [Clostridia bacterium]|nr:HD domain-containing protein [Clostridia bacterium]